MSMISRFFCSKWWHLFVAFYTMVLRANINAFNMVAILAYIIFFAVTQHILMAGFMVSTFFMLGIEIWIFVNVEKKTDEK